MAKKTNAHQKRSKRAWDSICSLREFPSDHQAACIIAEATYPTDLIKAAKLFDETDREGQTFGPQHPITRLRAALAAYGTPPS